MKLYNLNSIVSVELNDTHPRNITVVFSNEIKYTKSFETYQEVIDFYKNNIESRIKLTTFDDNLLLLENV